jgi:LysR family transcriptional regulator for metE and metH
MSFQIDLRLLRMLDALAQTGSLQQAAARMFVTQSALSHQLRQAEQSLGASLFMRKTQPVQFSEQGQQLLTLARQILPLLAAAEQKLNNPVINRLFRLTVECHACYHWLLPAVKAIRAQLPELSLELTTDIEHHAIEALLSGDLDLVLTTDDRLHQQVAYQPLFDLTLYAYLAPEHPLAAKAWLTPADLSDQTLLSYPIPPERQDLFRYFLKRQDFSGTQRQVGQASQILQLVAAGAGIAVLPGWLAEPYLSQGLLVLKPLGEHGLHRTMYLGCRRQELPRLPKLLVQLLRQHAPV